MPRYERCPPEIAESYAQPIINQYHDSLQHAGVTLEYMFAFRIQDPDSLEFLEDCAIKANGYGAIGLAKILNIENRVMGRADGLITLDGDWWKDADEDERKSLVDHELMHFKLKLNPRTGDVVLDDIGRPKLEMRLHDHQIGVFDKVAARWGRFGIERRSLRNFMEKSGQFYLPEIFEQLGGQMPGTQENIVPAAQKFVQAMRKSVPKGGSVTISGGGHSAAIHGEDLDEAASTGQ